jgi:hypothetical protein
VDSQASRAVCILGMHRSGTSMISRSLNLLGIELGDSEKLVVGSKYNPKGFWEFKQITRTQNKILKTFGHEWHTPKSLPPKWYENGEIEPLKEKLEKIVLTEFKDKKLWGWKDPRTSLLVPIWEDMLVGQGIDLSYVIVVRNPLDVAASLERRNQFEVEKSIKLWGLYTLSALLSTYDKRRTIILYDEFIVNWKKELSRVSEQLEIPLPENQEELYKELDEFISNSLQHSRSTLEDLTNNPAVPKWVIATYALTLLAKSSPEIMKSKEFYYQLRKIYRKQFK